MNDLDGTIAMRLTALAMLLLTAASPAFATLDPDEPTPRMGRAERAAQRAERAEANGQSDQREARWQRSERDEPPAPPRPERPRRERPAMAEPASPMPAPATELRGQRAEGRRDREPPADGVANWRFRERVAARVREAAPPPLAEPATGGPERPSGQFGDRRDRPQPPVVHRGDRGERERGGERIGDRLRDRVAAEGWRKEWRRDHRYDWRRHRDRDRRRFHVGIYIDPFGWRYRPWQLDWRLPSRYYSSRYWISDPYYYSLPPVYAPYRWVRYWNDALLVDLRTGRVVDVIPNFFW